MLAERHNKFFGNSHELVWQILLASVSEKRCDMVNQVSINSKKGVAP